MSSFIREGILFKIHLRYDDGIKDGTISDRNSVFDSISEFFFLISECKKLLIEIFFNETIKKRLK